MPRPTQDHNHHQAPPAPAATETTATTMPQPTTNTTMTPPVTKQTIITETITTTSTKNTLTHTHTPTNTVCCRLRATKSPLCRNKSTSLWGWYSIFRTNEQLEAFWIYTNLEFPTVSHTDFWSQGSTKTMRALSTNATTSAEVPVKHVLPSSTDKAA